MKINRLLTAALITFATVLTGCVKESVWDRETGIDSSKAAPEGFSFDANESSNTAIAVYWNGDAAKAAGAQSFLVQLTDQNNMDKGNTWDSSVTQVYQITDNPADYTAAKFEGLVEGKRYYVRVRANYPGSVYSQWAYVASPEGKELQCEVGTGPINPDAVKPETLTYNASKGTATSMTFDAVATAAKSAGAKGLVYRLVNYETGLAVVKETTISTLSATFDELEVKSQHKAKVAAVYETADGGVYYSDWTFANALIKNDAGVQIKTELFEVGAGAIEDKGVRPRVQLVYATSGELAVEWTSTGFKNPGVDFESEYSIQLYRDNACTDLIVSWNIAANRGVEAGPDGAGSQKNTPKDNCPRFAFSGLEANTTYYVMVTNLTTNMTSSPVAMKTAEFTPVMISATTAAAGDIILAEDFSELIWGGTHVTKFPGYSSDIRNKIPYAQATGVNPVGLDGTQFYLCDSSIEIGFFNTLKLSVPYTRLANWGSMTENNTQGGYILARQGHLKLGASSQIGRIVTPALSSLAETATIELSFKAALYGEDVTSGGVWVITTSDDVTQTQNLITNAEGASSEVHKFDLGKSTEWTTHTVEIKNVTPESRIMIGNIRTAGTVAGTDQQRMYLDEVVIKVVSYGGEAVELVPPTHTSITLTPDQGQITATWNPVASATGYVLAYKKATEGDDAWTEVKLGKVTEYTLEGLDELTTYEVKMKATAAGDNESEWSAVVSATTPEMQLVVTQRLLMSSESQLGIEWSAYDFAEDKKLKDIEESWTISLYKDAACTDLHATVHMKEGGLPAEAANAYYNGANATLWNWNTEAWPVPYSTRFGFSGLQPNTSYWLKVINVKKELESVAEYKTQPSNLVEYSSAPAAAGSTILYEDFSELVWGGIRVVADGIPGYSSYDRDVLNHFINLTGDQPLADQVAQLYLVRHNTEIGLFNTMRAIIPNCRMRNWASEAEDISSVCASAGCLKIGGSKKTGRIVTPALDCLTGNATLEVSFDASLYTEATADPLTGIVEVLSPETVPGNTVGGVVKNVTNFIEAATKVVVKEVKFTLDAEYGFKRYTYTIEGVAPGSRIGIGPNREDGSKAGDNQHRMFVDNIQVKVVEYK